jgi:hypothetical protein
MFRNGENKLKDSAKAMLQLHLKGILMILLANVGLECRSMRIRTVSIFSTYQARPASSRMPKVQNPSKQTSTMPLFFAGKNSVYIENATGAPPMPKPSKPRNMHIVARLPAAVDAKPTGVKKIISIKKTRVTSARSDLRTLVNRAVTKYPIFRPKLLYHRVSS